MARPLVKILNNYPNILCLRAFVKKNISHAGKQLFNFARCSKFNAQFTNDEHSYIRLDPLH